MGHVQSIWHVTEQLFHVGKNFYFTKKDLQPPRDLSSNVVYEKIKLHVLSKRMYYFSTPQYIMLNLFLKKCIKIAVRTSFENLKGDMHFLSLFFILSYLDVCFVYF